MQLTVHQLGRIAHAQLDMRPLTVFIGKNGTCKTWTAHAYFKLLEQLRVEGRPRLRLEAPPLARMDPGQLALELAQEWHAMVASQAGSVSFSLTRDELVARLPAELEFHVRDWPGALGTRLPPSARASLHVSREELSRGEVERIEVMVLKQPLCVQRTVWLVSEAEPRTTTSYATPDNLLDKLHEAAIDLLFGWRKHVRVLPAERVCLGLVYPILLDQRLPMPRALVDFLFMMSQGSASRAASSPDLAAAIATIVGGNLAFHEQELEFRPHGAQGIVLPLKATASLVKSLAGLHVFLSSAVPGDVLVIDEPEMNAHPEAQVALTELFVALVRRGIHVVLATHSPYVVDHLSTLVEASKLEAATRARLSAHFALASGEIFVHPEELAVYHFEASGEVREVFDRSTGVIDWSTFTQVSARESRVVAELVAAEVGDEEPHG